MIKLKQKIRRLKMRYKVNASCVVAAICFLFISAFPVSADTLTIGDGFYGVEDVSLTYNSNSSTMETDVGMILVNSDGDTWAFCVDLSTPLGSSGTYEFVTRDPTTYNENLLYVEWLLDESADKAYSLESNYRSAALQLVVWEILTDLDINVPNNYDLNFASSEYDSVANTFWYDSDTTYSLVDDWYNYYIKLLIKELTTGFTYTSSGDYIVADLADDQDLIVNVVPEPTTALLFGFGLLGLCAFGRKKD